MCMPTLNECLEIFQVIKIWFFWAIIHGVIGSILTIPLMGIFKKSLKRA